MCDPYGRGGGRGDFRMVTVVAATSMECLQLNSDVLRSFFRASPSAAERV